MTDTSVKWIDELILEGQSIADAARPSQYLPTGSPLVDHGAFTGWKSQVVTCLNNAFGSNNEYSNNLKRLITTSSYSWLETGLGILRSAKRQLESGYLDSAPVGPTPLALIEQICSCFHLIVRQLRSRHDSRQTLNVQDEYDLQDLMHGLLHLHFDDIRPEEWTPSYAGKSARMDFLLKKERVVVEVKMSRERLTGKEVGDQLIIDIGRYQVHPDCGMLICFVYDPLGMIANPRGIEADLSRPADTFPVHVWVRP